MRGKVLTRNFVDNLEQVIVPLMDQYWFLNNKDNTTHDAPTHDDILEVINTQPDMEQLMIQGFNAAGPLLMVSIQMLAINALLHNMEKFAYEAVRSPATGAFKVNPYQDTMMDYLFNAILMRCRPMQRRDSLYDRRRLANRQSGYQQPTRTSSKRFQDSHSSSTGQLSLGSCSNNSGCSMIQNQSQLVWQPGHGWTGQGRTRWQTWDKLQLMQSTQQTNFQLWPTRGRQWRRRQREWQGWPCTTIP